MSLMGTVSAALVLAVSLAACDSATDSTSSVVDSTPGEAQCTAQLVTSQTGSGSSCSGGSKHLWPIGMAAKDCHGWVAVDNDGKEHLNSANQIQCNPDGSVSFVQFANSLDCTEIVGAGVAKSFKVGTCEQDIPPTLYTTGIDTACCTDPAAAGCVTGSPSALDGKATIYLNGKKCAP